MGELVVVTSLNRARPFDESFLSLATLLKIYVNYMKLIVNWVLQFGIQND